MLEILVTGGVGVVSGAISAFVSYLVTRKKYESEVQTNDINNMSQSLDFWVKTSENQKQELEQLHEKCAKLQERNDQLERDIAELKHNMYNFMAQVCLSHTCKLRQPLDEETFNARFKD